MLRAENAGAVLPGRCFICERAFEEGEGATFTQFTYSPDWDSRLYGNKMVCDNCVHELATQNGFVSQDEVTKTVQEMEDEIDQYKLLAAESAVSAPPTAADIAAEVAKLMKPKPRSKPSAESAA